VNNLAGVFGAAVDSAQKAKFVKHAKQLPDSVPNINFRAFLLHSYVAHSTNLY